MPKKNYKRIYLKTIALLTLVRWYNIILLILAQYLASFLVLRSPGEWRTSVLDFRLHLIILSSALVIAAGFVINSFYDKEKDLINRPQETLFQRLISQKTAFQISILFNALAILLAYVVSWRAALFYFVYGAAIWYYSHRIKKVTFFGNLAAAILAITPFFGIFFYFGSIHWDLFLYVSFLLFIELCRELVKDLQAVKGDVIIGYPTVPVVLGVRKTKALILLINFISFIPAFLVYQVFSFPVFLYLVSSLMAVTVTNIYLSWDDDEERVVRVNQFYKILMVASVFSLVLFVV